MYQKGSLKENDSGIQEHLAFIDHLSQAYAAIHRIPYLTYQYNKRKLVFQTEKVKLFHYQSKSKKPHGAPLLVVFATVNRPEILDLFPNRSFIGGLLEKNMDVYLLDWGYPDAGDKEIKFSDYVTKYLDQCVHFIRHYASCKQIDMLGICQGGLICLCYAAFTQHVKNLVLISAPIDFHTQPNVVAEFLQKIDMNKYVELFGNISGMWLTHFFISLRPFELIGKKYLRFVDHIMDKKKTAQFLQVEKWLYDAPDQPGIAFAEFVNEFYKHNKLIKGEYTIQGTKIDLSTLNMPILNVMAQEDEIIPIHSSLPLKNYVDQKNYTEKIYPSGHIGIYISEKVGKNMSSDIAEWLQLHSEITLDKKEKENDVEY